MPERTTGPDAPHGDPPASGEPTPPSRIVGLGASAGGIKALKQFFALAPSDAGIAYVVIVHMSPVHESSLAEVLQVDTTLPVTPVREKVAIEPNHVYVVSPNMALRMQDGHLLVSAVDTVEERRAPIDIFFRTLADAHGEAAVAIVLSGSGADGSSGIKRIKERAGLVIVQDPTEAEYPDMPLSSIRTGVVDYTLPIEAMSSRILAYDGHTVDWRPKMSTASGAVAPEQGRRLTDAMPVTGIDAETAELYNTALTVLRIRTGHDFTNYKPATVLRRIARRMRLHQLSDLPGYTAHLRADPAEPAALMKELLISVTNFFRDPDVFAALETRIIPRMFERRRAQDQVRVWIAGCATGEEAYSLAMLLAERRDLMTEAPSIQVFATDLDAQAIAVARDGLYNEADVADVSPARLQRFFQRDGTGYRVRRELRELILFAHHNAIKDPPFSHLDLVSCRNLLIYLNRPAQERLLDTFHFALRPGGFLLLGTSESSEGSAELFASVDKMAHVYESRAVSTRPQPLRSDLLPDRRHVVEPLLLPEPRVPKHIFPADLHLRLLEAYAAPSLVVTEDYSIVHLSERVNEYLELHGGEPSRDLFKLLRQELRVEVRIAVRRAQQEQTAVAVAPIAITTARGRHGVQVVVRPVLGGNDPARGYCLLIFKAVDDLPDPLATVEAADRQSAALVLHEELGRTKDELRGTIEQYETQVEEARAANEELQALNEELRSSAEELETSREELQSVNEELTTVNQELKIKIEELRLTNDDFQNFINATDVATIFVDRGLRVKLSTLQARQIFNLLPTDTGRRLSDITSKIRYPGLNDDLKRVVDLLQPIERQVSTSDNRTMLLRATPYRTADDRIEGAVLTCLDITSRVADEERIRSGEERFRLLIASAEDYAIFTMTDDGVVDSWNVGAERMFGYGATEIVGSNFALLFTPEDRAAGVPEQELATAARDGRASDERMHARKDGSRFYCSGVSTGLGGGFGFAKIARDLTTQRDAAVALQQAYDGLEGRVRERTRELREEVARRSTAQTQVMSLVRKVVTAQEDERGRIARDLHDHLGQQLTALRLTLEEYRRVAAPSGAPQIERALALAREIDSDVDFLAWELRPAMLDDLGLAAALPRFLEQWGEHCGITAEFRSSDVAANRLPADVEVTFYRVAQEALNNIVKHAHASRVDVLLESRGADVVLVIEDDGIGFDAGDVNVTQRGIGLVSMRERAGLAGARLEVESSVGRGTSVYLRWSAVTSNDNL